MTGSPAMRGAIALAGALVVNGLLIAGTALWMEAGRAPEREREVREPTRIPLVERPKPKPKEQQRRRTTKRRQPPRANLPSLDLASAIPVPVFEVDDPQSGEILHPVSTEKLDPLAGGAILTEDTVDDPPRPVERAALRYPKAAEREGVEGEVEARLLLEADGTVSAVRILRATPAGIFEDAARDSLERWRFSPATFRGRRVRVWVRQRLVFELR